MQCSCIPCSDSSCWSGLFSRRVRQGGTAGNPAVKKILLEPWISTPAKMWRSSQTFIVGAKLHFASRRLKKKLAKVEDLDEDEEQEQWNVVHRSNAKLVLQHIYKYQGFFTKVGQSMSAKKGHLPAPWVETLLPLQNDMPCTRFAAVRNIIQRDFGKPWQELFLDFEEEPVASASIAQAHIAHLRVDGGKVCVKVQHPGVAELMGADLKTIEILLWLMNKLHDDAPDLSGIAKEWRRASSEEVDFRLEAQNAVDAFRALERSGLQVGSCEPVHQYTSRRVLTMKFVEGWKISQVEEFPPSADRESIGKQLWEGFALLVFQEGLIHGDPHPGNVFVQTVASNSQELRPVFLDWGIVKRLTLQDRVALAKWVIATLSKDRVLYHSAMQELGFELAPDLDHKRLDQFMQGSMMSLCETVPSSSMKQFVQQRQKIEETEREQAKAKAKTNLKENKKKFKFSGTILYFFRGVQLLHDCCGMLEVSVPVAKVMLKYAMPLVASHNCSIPLTPPPQSTDLEISVLKYLRDLKDAGVLIGAQVAVLRGSSDWLCDVSVGSAGPTAGPVSSRTMFPLLDVGISVLLTLLLASLSRKSATGKTVGLDTNVESIWPEFSQRGKGGVSIRELLQHEAGLQKPFSSKINYRTCCNEHKIEDALAASPHQETGSGNACHVVGVAIAALLRRLTGHHTIAQSLKSLLEPLGLHENIAYSNENELMAYVGHKLLDDVTMATMWELLEQREEHCGADGTSKPAPWLTWQEFNELQPWCNDPLLVNRDDLRTGQTCIAGRGLRASARALCQLYALDIVPAEIMKQACGHVRKLNVASVEEWENLGQCLDIGLGWQVHKFETLEGRQESFGYGFQDGSTGSVALRLPGVSVAILLNCVDKDARHAGRDLLSVLAAHLGLLPIIPAMPSITQAVKRDINPGVAIGTDDVIASLQKMETQIAKLNEILRTSSTSSVVSSSSALESVGGGLFRGRWVSAESENLDAMFEALNLPAIARKLAKNMKRVFVIEEHADFMKIRTTTHIGPRKLEESETQFTVGEAFQGKFGMIGSYQGMARWIDASVCKALVLEKRFSVKGNSVLLEETYQITLEGRMSLETCIKGQGDKEIQILSAADRDHFCRCLDRSSLRLKTEAELTNGVVFRCGRVVAPESCTSFISLTSVTVPIKLVLRYEDIRSATKFDAEGGPRPLVTPMTSFSHGQSNSSSMCSSWISPSVLMEGFVWKRSRHLKSWRKRRLTLTSDELKCFHDDQRATEVIPVRSMQQIRSADDVHPCCLCIKFGRRNIYLSFEDQAAKQKWLQELARLVSHSGSLIDRERSSMQ